MAKSALLTFWVEPDVVRRLDARADRIRRSRSWLLREIVGEYLDGGPSPDQPVRELKAEPFEGSV